MPEEGMKLIASSGGVNIYCPEEGRYSFFNSPYPMHRLCAGVDVYPGGTFGDAAPSPVHGKVIKVRMVKCPQGKGFRSSDRDYVILLQSLENAERWIKILHVEPFVKVGDNVEPGAELGNLIRSGFFDFWTDAHIHVEGRKPSDPIRARGGFKIERLIEVDISETNPKDLTGMVIESKPEYSLVTLDEKLEQGVGVDLDGKVGILDAGIPHYGWIGVHTNSSHPVGRAVRLCGKEIGTVTHTYSDMCVAKCCDPVFTLKGKQIRLSLYLYVNSAPLVKIIPPQPGSLNLERSERVTVSIS